jgi:hypothetical protein
MGAHRDRYSLNGHRRKSEADRRQKLASRTIIIRCKLSCEHAHACSRQAVGRKSETLTAPPYRQQTFVAAEGARCSIAVGLCVH